MRGGTTTGSQGKAAARQQIFISYRRDRDSPHAGRLYEAMADHLGAENVFMDIAMPPGVDFVDQIDGVLSGCAALIVVIGPDWTELAGEDGRPRLHDDSDFVRREIAAALARDDVTVIPILVEGATMPQSEHLPDDLHPLTRRNALKLSHDGWRDDFRRLLAVLDPLIPDPDPEPVPSAALPFEAALLAAAAGYAGRWLAAAIPDMSGTAGAIAAVATQRAVAWGLVGLALAPWLAWRMGRRNLLYLTLLGLFVGLVAGIAGGLVYALPHKLPTPPVPVNAEPGWGVLSLAVTGGILGVLLGWLWRPPRPEIGLLGGLAGGVLCRLLLDGADWLGTGTSDLAISFAILAAGVATVAVIALSARSYYAATAPRPD